MFKDKAHFVEELTKSIQKDIAAKAEELKKGLHLRGGAAGDATKQAQAQIAKERAGMPAQYARLKSALGTHPEGSIKYEKVKENIRLHEDKMRAAGLEPDSE